MAHTRHGYRQCTSCFCPVRPFSGTRYAPQSPVGTIDKMGAESLPSTRSRTLSFVKSTLRDVTMDHKTRRIIFKLPPMAKKFLYTFFACIVLVVGWLFYIQTHHKHIHIIKQRQATHRDFNMKKRMKEAESRKYINLDPRNPHIDVPKKTELEILREKLKSLQAENEKLKAANDIRADSL